MMPRLLVITQIIDTEDSHLGFFHEWLARLAGKFSSVAAICLKLGKFDLPQNVKVFSLGKEGGQSRIKYIFRFFKYIWSERRNYDAVFVHMNQEYVLLGWWLWKFFGKKVYMWRNHHSGTFLTNLAGKICDKVFCTSRFSYTAKFRNTTLMPVGVNTDKFKSLKVSRSKNSILFLGRIAPTKNTDVFIEALGILKKQAVSFSADIVGDALPKDFEYLEKLKIRARELGLDGIVNFHSGVPHNKTQILYNSHEIFVNLSSSGMYDKTIFEAFAAGCLVLASNDNLRGEVDERIVLHDKTPEVVAARLKELLSLNLTEKEKILAEETRFAERHSLEALMSEFVTQIKI